MPTSPYRLSIIVPVYNEERTIEAILDRLATGPYPDQQVVVVDDGSTDRTPELLRKWAGRPGLLVLRHPVNLGKGAAVRTALAHAAGHVTVIQDADLEYDPADLPRVVGPILRGECDAVYGSRYLAPAQRLPWSRFRLAVVGMNVLVRLLYGQRLTDVATCYKALRTDVYRQLQLRSERFELCAEMTAKLCRLGVHIPEVPIGYKPRSRAEGKKIGWRDAWWFAWTMCAWRFRRVPAGHDAHALPAPHRAAAFTTATAGSPPPF